MIPPWGWIRLLISPGLKSACKPVLCIPPLLEKVRQDQLLVILVAPSFGSMVHRDDLHVAFHGSPVSEGVPAHPGPAPSGLVAERDSLSRAICLLMLYRLFRQLNPHPV